MIAEHDALLSNLKLSRRILVQQLAGGPLDQAVIQISLRIRPPLRQLRL